MKVRLKDCRRGDAVLWGGAITEVESVREDIVMLWTTGVEIEKYTDPDTEVTLLAPIADTWREACEAIRLGIPYERAANHDDPNTAGRAAIRDEVIGELRKWITGIATDPAPPKEQQ